MDIRGRVVVITGGASGLGRATAELALARGARVALLDVNGELARATASQLGPDAAAFACDVADDASATAAIAAVVAHFGSIHVNVNCAGIGTAGRTLGRDGPLALNWFRRTIEVNLIGTFNTLRLCAAAMANNAPLNEDGERGVIVNTASVAAFDGQIGQAAYSASKGGVVGMTLPIARDLARSGIRVCTIAPGIFETPMLMGASPEMRKPLIDMVQFPHRLGAAPEHAAMALHIVENGYLNGEVIRLDGGIRLQPR